MTRNDIDAAWQRIALHIRETPLEQSDELGDLPVF